MRRFFLSKDDLRELWWKWLPTVGDLRERSSRPKLVSEIVDF